MNLRALSTASAEGFPVLPPASVPDPTSTSGLSRHSVPRRVRGRNQIEPVRRYGGRCLGPVRDDPTRHDYSVQATGLSPLRLSLHISQTNSRLVSFVSQSRQLSAFHQAPSMLASIQPDGYKRIPRQTSRAGWIDSARSAGRLPSLHDKQPIKPSIHVRSESGT